MSDSVLKPSFFRSPLLQVLALTALSFLGLQAQPPAPAKPKVVVNLQIRKPYLPGVHALLASESWCALRAGGEWLVFPADQPEHHSAHTIKLPEAAATAASSLTTDYLYVNKGREIWRRRKAGGEWSLWFTAQRNFHAFHAVDDERVVLVWAEEPQATPPFPNVYLDPKAMTAEAQSFIEDWDVPRERLLQRVPMPAELAGWSAFQGNPRHLVGPLCTLRSPEHLLVFASGFGLLYDYNVSRHALQRLQTPWVHLDAKDIFWSIQKAPPALDYLISTDFCPFPVSMTPQGDGGFVFAWYERSFTEASVRDGLARFARLKPTTVIFPPNPDKDGPAEESRFRMAIWSPGKTSLKEVKTTGPMDPNDRGNEKSQAAARHVFQGGVFGSATGEAEPLDKVLARIRSAIEKHAAKLAAEPNRNH